jgi:hypothetical protein
MHDSSGTIRPVGYHQVHQALDQGYLFTDKPTLQRYASDHAADPLDESRVDQWIDKHPILSLPIQGPRGIAKGAAGLLSTPGSRPPASRWETELQLFGATPAHTMTEELGSTAENVGEFMSGEELLSMLGRAGTLAKLGEKFKDVSGLSAMIEKYPMIGKLLKIGASSVKAGTVSGAQTLQRTGDPGAAGTSAVLGAAAGPAAETVGAAGSAIKTMVKGTGETAAAEAAAAAAARQTQAAENVAASERQAAESRAQYAQHAREAARPTIEQTNVARNVPTQEVMMNQPGGEAIPTGRRVATATGKAPLPQINVDQVLNQIHDFTGAADHLTAINDEAYTQFDAATGGRFRQLNGEVMAAQNAARKGEKGAATLYKQKLAEMDQLMDSTQGEMTPEMKAAAKAGFHQSYVLRDFGNLWDRNLNGLPGASQASQSGRGINGKGLLTDLQRAVKMYGRSAIEDSLGNGRLESLEEIAQQNITEKQRMAFNGGIKTVADELERLDRQALKTGKPTIQEQLTPWGKRTLAMTAGGAIAHLADVSPYFGMVAGEATYESSRAVLNAIKTNPKIAQNFLFAIQSGARAERYGPLIATMIQKAVTESSRQQQMKQEEQNAK